MSHGHGLPNHLPDSAYSRFDVGGKWLRGKSAKISDRHFAMLDCSREQLRVVHGYGPW